MGNFKSPFKVGQVIKNEELVSKFKVGNSGGMRRSIENKTLVIICDHTKGLYDDKWYGNILHYTGIGKKGDQDRQYLQNKTLSESNFNGVDVHLFEVLEKKKYIYLGIVKLCGEPYQENQKDENGLMRKVWMFPLKLVNNNVAINDNSFESYESNQKKNAKSLPQEDLEIKANERSNKTPSYRQITSKTYVRDQYVAEYSKRRAKGICQLCEKPAPFNDKEGKPYLESHHIIWLSKGGEDSIDNTVALCPNCHKKMHLINSSEDIVKLLSKIKK